MPASPAAGRSARRQRSQHLEQLERFLRHQGAYGTAFVDSDAELADTWNGLLAWDIRDGAQSGTTIRCDQHEPDGTWHYLDDAGHVLAAVPDCLGVHHELARRRLGTSPEALRVQ
ncbi:hypothetical protein [Flindersiella endophytica]